MNKAVFLDKDGTLIPDIPYNVDPARITLQDEAIEGLQFLKKQGYLLIVVSNQSGVARGYFEEDALAVVKNRLNMLLAAHNVSLDGFYYCPHHPDGKVLEYTFNCNCRKPEPGLLLKAVIDHDINISRSWMIGDILNDVEAGNRAGCKTILIDNGNETEWQGGIYRTPTFICNTINEAAAYIFNKQLHDEKLVWL